MVTDFLLVYTLIKWIKNSTTALNSNAVSAAFYTSQSVWQQKEYPLDVHSWSLSSRDDGTFVSSKASQRDTEPQKRMALRSSSACAGSAPERAAARLRLVFRRCLSRRLLPFQSNYKHYVLFKDSMQPLCCTLNSKIDPRRKSDCWYFWDYRRLCADMRKQSHNLVFRCNSMPAKDYSHHLSTRVWENVFVNPSQELCLNNNVCIV